MGTGYQGPFPHMALEFKPCLLKPPGCPDHELCGYALDIELSKCPDLDLSAEC